MTDKETETPPFSRAYQVGIVVRDMDKAIEFYESLGIGPFHEGPSAIAIDRKVYGKPADVKIRGAITQLGQIEFELFEPIEGESIQKEFLDTKGEGVVHIGSYVDDIDSEVAKLVEKGFEVISSGGISDGGKFAYIDTRAIGGVVLELFQAGTTWK